MFSSWFRIPTRQFYSILLPGKTAILERVSLRSWSCMPSTSATGRLFFGCVLLYLTLLVLLLIPGDPSFSPRYFSVACDGVADCVPVLCSVVVLWWCRWLLVSVLSTLRLERRPRIFPVFCVWFLSSFGDTTERQGSGVPCFLDEAALLVIAVLLQKWIRARSDYSNKLRGVI